MSGPTVSGGGVSGPADFTAYLRGRYRASTAWAYGRQAGRYVAWAGGEAAAAEAGYAEVLAYVSGLRSAGLASRSVHAALAAVRAYYAWLAWAGVRVDHPCRSLRLADRVDRAIRTEGLYGRERIEAWARGATANRPEHQARARVMAGLLAYQAATTAEVAALRVGDVDVEAATVRLGVPDGQAAARTLPLRGGQAVALWRYLEEDRGAYVAAARERGLPEEYLVFGRRGAALQAQHVGRIVNAGRCVGERLAPRTVRQSVIAALLGEGHDVRVVQAFAGHRTAEATAAYRVTDAEALAGAIARCHPRGGGEYVQTNRAP